MKDGERIYNLARIKREGHTYIDGVDVSYLMSAGCDTTETHSQDTAKQYTNISVSGIGNYYGDVILVKNTTSGLYFIQLDDYTGEVYTEVSNKFAQAFIEEFGEINEDK